jgi:predicted dehydrogenase
MVAGSLMPRHYLFMRFGLLGTGYWAREVHAAALAAHPEVEFAGVWGRNPQAAEVIGARYQVKAFTEVDELFANVEAVAVALPPDVQAELAVRAAKANCHLLLDKPVALTTTAADALVAQADQSGVRSVVFFTNRFQPATVTALREMTATGGWNGARATFFGSIQGTPFEDSPWRQQFGGLWDIGPHALSLILPVLGPVAEISAMSGPRHTTHVTMKHDSGTVSSMELTLDAAPAASVIETVFHGESGWLTLPGFDGDAVAALGRAITELISSERSAVDVHFGREVTRVLEAAAQSAAS